MVKISEIKPKSKSSKAKGKQPASDSDYTDEDEKVVYSEADSDPILDEDDDIMNETLWDRISALGDIFPAHAREEFGNKITGYWRSAVKSAKFMGNVAWILTTSAMVVAVPLIFEMEREQSLLAWEKEQQMQKQGAQKVSLILNV